MRIRVVMVGVVTVTRTTVSEGLDVIVVIAGVNVGVEVKSANLNCLSTASFVTCMVKTTN